jgi:TolA-binding protein
MRVTVAEGAVEVSDGSVSGLLPAGKERTIIGSEPKQPETAPVTKPKDNTGVVIEPVDPGANSEFTSSSDDGLPELRQKVRAAQERVGQIENEIRRLREENRLMRKELDERGDRPENKEHKQPERERRNNE